MSARQCRQSKKVTSVTAGTIFHDAHYPLRTLFDVAWQMCEPKNGVRILGLKTGERFWQLAYAWDWSHRFRRLMDSHDGANLNGTVEVDEAFIGGVKSGVRGRGALGKVKVFVAAESGGNAIGRIRLKVIPDTTSATLLKAVKANIDLRSHIVTDGNSAYAPLEVSGYKHTVEGPALGKNRLLKAHRAISLLKRWLLGTHHGAVNEDRLQSYLDEFVFRFNRRTAKSRGLLFHRLMERAVTAGPIKGADL